MDDLMRDKFMELVYDLLSDDEDNQRANMIINCADEYAESMKQQWIPVEERLPRQGQEVICQCRANIIKVLKLDADGDWYQDAEHCYMSGFVVAWMPLPDPYQKRGDQDGMEK